MKKVVIKSCEDIDSCFIIVNLIDENLLLYSKHFDMEKEESMIERYKQFYISKGYEVEVTERLKQ